MIMVIKYSWEQGFVIDVISIHKSCVLDANTLVLVYVDKFIKNTLIYACQPNTFNSFHSFS